MKYLKRFRESHSEDDAKNIEMLNSEAKHYLSHLLDNGDWGVNVSTGGYYEGKYNSYDIWIEYIKEDEYGDGMMFPLSKVRVDIMQYIDYMMHKYEVKDDFLVYYENKNDDSDSFTKAQLERKNIKISYIKFNVKIYL